MDEELRSTDARVIILDGLSLTDYNLDTLRGPYAQLFGAAISLVEAYELAVRNPGCIESGTWNLDLLGTDFSTAVRDKKVYWECTQNLANWSFGFFVNSAQARVSNTIERSLNLWLEKTEQPDLTYSFFEVRAKRLLERALIDETRLLIDRFCLSQAKYKPNRKKKTEPSADYVNTRVAKWAKYWTPPSSVLDAFESYADLGVDCAGVVWSRANKFKHAPTGTQDKTGHGLLIEWGITAKSFLWAREFMWAIQRELQEAESRSGSFTSLNGVGMISNK